jgi:hypothetical protein
MMVNITLSRSNAAAQTPLPALTLATKLTEGNTP